MPLQVPRVAGNIHFAPGKSFQYANVHVHDLMSFALQTFNVTHTINSFSFGHRVDVGAASCALVAGGGTQAVQAYAHACFTPFLVSTHTTATRCV